MISSFRPVTCSQAPPCKCYIWMGMGGFSISKRCRRLTSFFLFQCFACSDPEERVWVWTYEDDKLFMDIEEKIRFQILSEEFTDTTPTPTNIGPTGRRQSAADTTAINDLAANSTKIAPYSLTVSYMHQCQSFSSLVFLETHVLRPLQGTIAEDGLGLLSWWGSA